MSLYEYERTKSALAEEQRKNAELARRIENTEEAKLNALHDLIDRLPGALPREESREDEDDDNGCLIQYTIRLSTEERLRGAIEYTKRRDEALIEIAKILAPGDEVVDSGDRVVAPTISRIPTPREIQDFEKRTKAEIARVQRQSRVDQAELMKVQEALVETGMPAGVTYRTWIAELQRKIAESRKDIDHASEVFIGIRDVIGPGPDIVEWVREAAKLKKILDGLYAEEQRFQRERIEAEADADTAKAKHDMEQIVKLLAQHGVRERYPVAAVREFIRESKASTKFVARLVCAIQPHGIVSSEASNDHAENEYLATDFMTEDQIVAWIRDAKKTIDSAPPANTAREDRNAICELGDLLLSGTKDCYAASAVVRMVKHLLTRPAVVEALKEAHETSWEWVLERVPNTNNRSYAGIILDDPVQAPRVTQENVEKAQTWLRDRGRILGVAFGIGERPKHADGRLRWRHMVMPGLPFLAARNMPRWFRFAYLIASHLRSRGAATMKARAQ